MEKGGAVRSPVLSFIVRVWDDQCDTGLRGEVEHLRTGERRMFSDYVSLQTVIEDWRESDLR